MPFTAWNALEAREVVPGYHGRFVHMEGMTLSYWEVTAGSTIPEHAHVHEQMMTVLQGRFEFTVGDETRVMEAGEVAIIPSNVPHKGTALADCLLIDVFQPARDDYR